MGYCTDVVILIEVDFGLVQAFVIFMGSCLRGLCQLLSSARLGEKAPLLLVIAMVSIYLHFPTQGVWLGSPLTVLFTALQKHAIECNV